MIHVNYLSIFFSFWKSDIWEAQFISNIQCFIRVNTPPPKIMSLRWWGRLPSFAPTSNLFVFTIISKYTHLTDVPKKFSREQRLRKCGKGCLLCTKSFVSLGKNFKWQMKLINDYIKNNFMFSCFNVGSFFHQKGLDKNICNGCGTIILHSLMNLKIECVFTLP